MFSCEFCVQSLRILHRSEPSIKLHEQTFSYLFQTRLSRHYFVIFDTLTFGTDRFLIYDFL